jgi:hypothetical protein
MQPRRGRQLLDNARGARYPVAGDSLPSGASGCSSASESAPLPHLVSPNKPHLVGRASRRLGQKVLAVGRADEAKRSSMRRSDRHAPPVVRPKAIAIRGH